MYKSLIRPFLFLFYPERVHHFIVVIIKFLFAIPGVRYLFSQIFNPERLNQSREVFGLTFKSLVGLAAGFDKNGEFFNEFASFGFSFIEVGTVTPKPQPGNEKPRSFRLVADHALINRMGFNNKGVDTLVKKLKKRRKGIIIGGNIGKNTATDNGKANDDYLYCFKALYDHVDYFVVNISCPNIKDLTKLQNKDTLLVLMQWIAGERQKQNQRKPVLIKISPDLSFNQIDDILDIIKQTGMDGVVATNTTVQREGLETDKKTIEGIGQGGLSGEPLARRSTEVIAYIHKKTSGQLPIIGSGGVMTAKDALEKIEAGASLVQVYTGFIYEGPCIAKKIKKQLLKTGLGT
jgi:dihydroorotate dehydrogenase